MQKNARGDALALLGGTIKMARLGKGMSQTQLAKNCGMEKASLSRIEAGKVNISYTTLYRISYALGIGMRDLIAQI